jgi:hypothetical protein
MMLRKALGCRRFMGITRPGNGLDRPMLPGTGLGGGVWVVELAGAGRPNTGLA